MTHDIYLFVWLPYNKTSRDASVHMEVIRITTSSIVCQQILSISNAANCQTMKSLVLEAKDNQLNNVGRQMSEAKIDWLQTTVFFREIQKDSHPAWIHDVGVCQWKHLKWMGLKKKSVGKLVSQLIIDGFPTSSPRI